VQILERAALNWRIFVNVPAVAILRGLWYLIHSYQEAGLTLLLLVTSGVSYYEATCVLNKKLSAVNNLFTSKWWWFIAYSLASTKSILPHASHLLLYSMIVGVFMAWILQLNTVNVSQAADHFWTAWQEMAYYHMAVVFTVLPVTFSMAVL
jgi:hypothetical protein